MLQYYYTLVFLLSGLQTELVNGDDISYGSSYSVIFREENHEQEHFQQLRIIDINTFGRQFEKVNETFASKLWKSTKLNKE